jgi:hypothetical protein
MDPQQMWQDIVDVAVSIDIEDLDPGASIDPDALVKMVEQILDLNRWLQRGGSAPKGVYPTKDTEQDIRNMEDKNEYPWDRRNRR